MRYRSLLVLLATVLCASAVSAERVLVPIAIDVELHGEYGSVFRSQLTITNASPDVIFILGAGGLCQTNNCDPRGGLAGNTTYHYDLYSTLLQVPDEDAEKLRYTLRVFDVSRQYSTWGTAIPVVREQEAFNGTFGITDIPNQEGFRSRLRVYSFSETAAGGFTLRVYGIPNNTNIPLGPDILIAEQEYPFTTTPETVAPVVELPLGTFFAGQPYTRFRVEITPTSPELQLWGMASVTHNQTQHITVLTP